MQKISFEDIHTCLVDVSEPISSTNMVEFIFYQLQQNEIESQATSVVFYSYLANSKKYFIAHFIKSQNDDYIQPQILKAYYLHQLSLSFQTDLFITEFYFALYCNKELLFFKEIKQKVTTSEVITFIEKTLLISIDNCIELSNKKHSELAFLFEKEYEQLKNLPILKNNNYKHIKQLLGVVGITVMLILSAFYYEYYQNKNREVKNTQVVIYPSKELTTHKLALIFKNINELSLKLITMDLNNESLTLLVQHKHKGELIDFLTRYGFEVKTLQYNEKENLYELSATFKLI